tara:strand:+ start:129 stop:374 length:246 start_codon:yes stop_codon:yes gene_type:complete
MAIGKSGATVKLEKLSLNMGPITILNKGNLDKNYNEDICSEYMKNENIEITVDLSIGNKNFTAYTMDLSKEYIEINSDYRS